MAPVEFKQRKILLVTNDLGPRSGGIETFILGLLAKLDGSEIVIYTSAQDGSADFDAELVKKYGVAICRDRTKILLPTLAVCVSGVARRGFSWSETWSPFRFFHSFDFKNIDIPLPALALDG